MTLLTVLLRLRAHVNNYKQAPYKLHSKFNLRFGVALNVFFTDKTLYEQCSDLCDSWPGKVEYKDFLLPASETDKSVAAALACERRAELLAYDKDEGPAAKFNWLEGDRAAQNRALLDWLIQELQS